MNKKPSGVVLYEGKSNYNDKQIVVIATGLKEKTANAKTGNMVQVWILVKNEHPIDANNKGHDETICGSCKHRHFRSCYVNLANGPSQVWSAYKRNRYPKVKMDSSTAELFRDKAIRLGAYGDPAVVPIKIWDYITMYSKTWTGYTHQWKIADISYRDYCMASCDTLKEAEDAISRGWKPFYVRQESQPLPKGFFTCPASKEAGKRLTCERCKVCKGGEYREGQGVPSIIAHGPSWKQAYFNAGMKLMEQKQKYVGIFVKGNTLLKR